VSTILIADDDLAVRTILRAVLQREGYEVVEAANGREALEALHQARPALVMLDVEMPEMDGWEALERIRESTDVPVMMLSAHAGEAHTVRGLRAGADDYVAKPFTKNELLARVDALLRRANAGSHEGP
jgi:DNA-binding response OmpR family regulator